MATKTTTDATTTRGRRTRKELRVDLSTIPGSRLIRAIELERERRKVTYDEAADQIGIGNYGANYLRRVQSGGILWSSSNLERLRLIAKWLRLSAIEVMVLADVIGPEDFERFRQPDSELDHLVEMMAADPRYAVMLPAHADLIALPRWAKITLVAAYQDASRRMLLPLARQVAD
jgi:transcriptional regulator with XRE-family HTH domain